MNKKEQKKFIEDTIESVVQNGFTIGYFLKQIKISRTHWYFIKNGERPLTEQKKQAINSFQKDRLSFINT